MCCCWRWREHHTAHSQPVDLWHLMMKHAFLVWVWIAYALGLRDVFCSSHTSFFLFFPPQHWRTSWACETFSWLEFFLTLKMLRNFEWNGMLLSCFLNRAISVESHNTCLHFWKMQDQLDEEKEDVWCQLAIDYPSASLLCDVGLRVYIPSPVTS